jgi:hypothetical protein
MNEANSTGLRFIAQAVEMATVDWSRCTKPKELERFFDKSPWMMVRRMRELFEARMHVVDMRLMSARTQTSLVAMRVINPREGIRAFGFVKRHRTVKRICQG